MLFAFGIIGLAALVVPIISMIKSDVAISLPMLMFVGAYQFLLFFRNCYTSYLSCTNRLDYMPAFVITALACLSLSFSLTQPAFLGMWGLVAAQIITQLAYNVWKWPLQVHRELNLGWWEMWRLGFSEMKVLIFNRRKEEAA
jgi:hypothetical protein